MPTKPICPVIHLNGTGADDMFKQYCDACGALRAAIAALPAPNARDYYPLGDSAFVQAREEHTARVTALHDIADGLQTILEGIADQRDERNALRSAMQTARRTP